MDLVLYLLLWVPFLPVMYGLMLTVADSIITTVRNWNDE